VAFVFAFASAFAFVAAAFQAGGFSSAVQRLTRESFHRMCRKPRSIFAVRLCHCGDLSCLPERCGEPSLGRLLDVARNLLYVVIVACPCRHNGTYPRRSTTFAPITNWVLYNPPSRKIAMPTIQLAESDAIEQLLDEVFRDPRIKHGLTFFRRNERRKIKMRRSDDKIEIWCAKREKWLRAKPEEVVRQLFLIWIQETLKYSMKRVEVEWPIQMGEDEEKERADIAVFSDDACTDPYLIFELKKPQSEQGLEQLRSYLRWTGCFFGSWSNGNDATFQLREEDQKNKKGPYKFRDIPRLPRLGEDLSAILRPLCFADLRPIDDMRSLIQRLEHDALANAGVNAFDELFKLFFAKLHDELRPKRKDTDEVDFRVPAASPEVIYKRFDDLLQAAKKRPNWGDILDPGEALKLKGDALKLCASAIEPYSLTHTDLEVVDAAFEYLINPEQKGQKGQYFTPRPVVKMAVQMLNPRDGELVLDPACGSCGFLIHTIRHVRKLYGWDQKDIYQYANEYIYANDFDDRLKKVAKVMMLIAGDGKANVLSVNALDVRDWQNSDAAKRIGVFSRDMRDGKFDVVMTNPPFAGKVTGKTQLYAYDLYELASTGQISDEEDEAETEAAEESGSEAAKLRARRKVGGMKRDVLFLERCLDLLKPGGRMAIVLPQGNLNNLGTRALRTWVGTRARILAVVGLHVNSFKPFTGTKTSVIFLQKWGGEAGNVVADYPIFMATSQKSGKNNSGEYIYRTDSLGNLVDEEGKPIVESGRPPAIDHDLEEIAEGFVRWGQEQGLPFCQTG
jgi:type I restriction enzyme M protein